MSKILHSSLRHFFAWTALFSTPLPAQTAEEEVPEPYRSLPGLIQPKAATFQEIAVTEGAVSPQQFEANLRKAALPLPGGYHCAVIRFQVPKTPQLDMVWAFTLPSAWENWYIMPVTGKGEGFKNWLDADRAYETLPTPDGQTLKLQTLEADRLKPGQEYLLWFMTSDATAPAVLRGMIHFAPKSGDVKKAWDHDAIEKTLHLKTADAPEQASFLKSRGALALLDKRFFEPKYAEGRIKSVLSDIRATSEANGYFVTMRTSIPNCRTSPSLIEIQKTHGEPDIVIPFAERKVLDPKLEADDRDQALACYDYLTFVYNEKDPLKTVLRVETGAYNLAGVRPEQDGLTFTDLPTPNLNLRLFYRDRQELARIAHWGEPEAKLLSGTLPAATFERPARRDSRERLVSDGSGNWTYQWQTAEGAPIRTAELKNHIYHGPLVDFYPDEKRRSEAPYIKGKLSGTAKQWDQAGKLVREREYKDGEPVK